MARHNEVFLHGMCIMEPTIIKNAEGEYVRGSVPLLVVRGQREIGTNKLIHVKYDSPVAMSGNPEIIKEMEKIHVHDMVELKGVFTTKDIQKAKPCKCGNLCKKPGTLTFISPIYIEKREHAENEMEGKKLLERRAEISNLITVIGNVAAEPEFYHEDKLSILQYKVGINRKYFLKEDATLSKADFPMIKEYGTQAEQSHKKIKQGTNVLVSGMLQTRAFTNKIACSECDEVVEFEDTVMEIVSYTTEYLSNFVTDDEISEKERQKLSEKTQELFG